MQLTNLGWLALWTMHASAATVGDFAAALAVPVGASHTANNWDHLAPVHGVQWRDAVVPEAPSAFARKGNFVIDELGPAEVLVVGARQMMFDAEFTLTVPLPAQGLVRKLAAQFPASTKIEPVRRVCSGPAAPARVYRVTLAARKPLYLWVQRGSAASSGAARITLSIDAKSLPKCSEAARGDAQIRKA